MERLPIINVVADPRIPEGSIIVGDMRTFDRVQPPEWPVDAGGNAQPINLYDYPRLREWLEAAEIMGAFEVSAIEAERAAKNFDKLMRRIRRAERVRLWAKAAAIIGAIALVSYFLTACNRPAKMDQAPPAKERRAANTWTEYSPLYAGWKHIREKEYDYIVYDHSRIVAYKRKDSAWTFIDEQAAFNVIIKEYQRRVH